MAPKESAVSEELREAELAAHDATIATHRAARLQEMANGDA
jgi:hypothetical protein